MSPQAVEIIKDTKVEEPAKIMYLGGGSTMETRQTISISNISRNNISKHSSEL